MKSPVTFVIMQTGARANGGLQSITEVMFRLQDHRPVVVTNLDSGLADEWRSRGIDVQVIGEHASAGFMQNPVGALRTYRRYGRAIRSILERTGASVVHANDPLAFQLAFGAARGRARIALNLRDTLDPQRRPPRLKYRALFSAADHVFYLSHDMAERWKAVASNATRAFSVTYSIVDPELFAFAPPPDRNRQVVLVPGKFWAKKGQLEFIRHVVPALAQKGIETWFAGDFDPGIDPYAAACAAAASPFGQQVHFLGFRSDLADLYRQSNVVAVPSRHEGLMRGMIEAMSCGRPVVSFEVCSAREVLEEQRSGAGSVVPLGDFEGMAQALARYVDDREMQVEAGKSASEVARALFNADKVVERYESVYASLGAK